MFNNYIMTDYKLCNIVDSQLEDITSELTLPVITGAASNNYQTFHSQGATGSTQIQFNVQVPSLSTALNRHFLVQTGLDLLVNIAGGNYCRLLGCKSNSFFVF